MTIIFRKGQKMAFFNNISKMVSEAGQTTIQKAKELSDITKYSSMISEEEKKINNTYYQIGKLFVSLYSNEADGEFVGMIASIAEAEGKIVQYRKQIQDIKGIRRCENCGSEVAKDALYCNSCGAAMPKAETMGNSDYIKCAGCGSMVKKGMRFCTTCGRTIETVSVIPESGQTEELNNQKLLKKCSNCGAELAEDMAFCSECGTKA